jgi:uncharacterized protein (DUF927 family)
MDKLIQPEEADNVVSLFDGEEIPSFKGKADDEVKAPLQPDLEETRRFLSALDPDPNAKFSFQTFDDLKADTGSPMQKRNHLSKIFQSHFSDEIAAKLSELNSRGAGVFVMVNKGDGCGRKAENVNGLRALFVDSDNGELPSLPSPPSIEVQTPRGPHIYWALKANEEVSGFTTAQKALIQSLGTDKLIHDPCRVMRLPGFFHVKNPDKPYLVKVRKIQDVQYSIADVVAALPKQASKKSRSQTKNTASKGAPGDFAAFQAWVSSLPTEEGPENQRGGRNKTLLCLVREGLGQGFSPEQLEPIVVDYCERASEAHEVGVEMLQRQTKEHGESPFTSCHATKSQFRVSDHAVHYVENGSENPPQWICSHLEIAAYTRNSEGNDWGRLLRFEDNDGNSKATAVPMHQLAGDGQQVRGRLLDMGLRISTEKSAHNRLSQYIQSYPVETRALCVSRVGWHGRMYVLPDGCIGPMPSGESVIFQSPEAHPVQFRCKGTLEEWSSQVAELCTDNPLLVFGVSMAFAASLLKLTGDESGGFHFRGSSTSGKTTAQIVAASVWGNLTDSGVRKWRSTLNGLEAVAEGHCDNLLILDELAQIDPKEAGSAAYLLANGSGKNRANEYGNARRSKEWTLLFLSSGECGLSEYMNEIGKRSRAGQELRMADIPADAGKGMGLFTNIHDFATPSDFAMELSKRSKQYCGIAGRTFIAKLHEDIGKYLDEVKHFRSSFVKKFVPTNSSAQVKRVGQRFALIGAAGELARRLKIVPWEMGDAFKAAGICFNSWIASRGGLEDAEPVAAIEQIRTFLSQHGHTRFVALGRLNDDENDASDSEEPYGASGEGKVFNRAGYRRQLANSSQEWWVLKEVFRSEVCKGFDPKMVALALKARGFLIPDSQGGTTYPTRVPGLGQVRVYRIKSSIMQEDDL